MTFQWHRYLCVGASLSMFDDEWISICCCKLTIVEYYDVIDAVFGKMIVISSTSVFGKINQSVISHYR